METTSGLNHDETLKAQILSVLSNGENSISGILKELNTRGVDMHRLTLTGYLNAMADMGILKERDIKPSKIYSIDMASSRDIYSIIGSVVKIYGEENMPDYALMLLNALFGRPIFIKEIERCNVGLPRDYRKVVPPKRMEYIDQLSTIGLTIPPSNSMVEPTRKDNDLINQMLRLVISQGFEIKGEYLGRSDSVQKTLD